MKLNKKVIILICSTILLIGFVTSMTIIILRQNNIEINDTKTVDTTYIAYVNINPLIKLTLKVSCKNDICTEPIITDYKLVNDDAKEIYNNIDIKNKSIEETIDILHKTATANNIDVKKINIYTNYDGGFNADVDYDIDVQIKEDKELTDDSIKETIDKEQYITKEVIFQRPDQVCYKDEFNIKEYMMSMNFTHNYSIDKAIVEISGPKDVISKICNESYQGYNNACNTTNEIVTCISIGNLEPGKHQVPIEIKPLIEGIEISNKRPNIIYNIEIIRRPQ